MRRFIAEKIEDGRALLSAQEARHALRVLRLAPGDSVQVTGGGGQLFAGAIEQLDDEGASVLISGALEANESPVSITLYQGLPKAEKLELVAQKAVELGASRLVPVRMERSVVKLDRCDAQKKRERLSRIALEAIKQTGRARLMAVEAAMDFSAALQDMAAQELMLMPWEEARGYGMKDAHRDRPGALGIGILIGPEGGISAREAEMVIGRGGLAVTLGPRILRAETAAIASLCACQLLWGDLP